MKDCTFPRCGCSERVQCRPEDALKAALARAEAAEKERDEWRQACLAHGEKAERAERQRDEAIAASDARVEAMREAAAKVAWSWSEIFSEIPINVVAAHEYATQAVLDVADAIRALPIPAQEK